MKKLTVRDWILIAVIVAAAVGIWRLSSAYQDRLKAEAALRAHRDSTYTVYQDSIITVQETLALTLQNERVARRVLEDRVPELARRIRDLGAENRGLVTANARLQREVVEGAATDTVIIVQGDTVHQVSFEQETEGYLVSGWIRTPPPRYRVEVEPKPFDLTVALSRLPGGGWLVDTQVPSWVEIDSVSTLVYDPPPDWWSRNKFKVGLGLGVLTAGVVVYLLRP